MARKVETTRLGINVPTELFERLDDYAAQMNISRTSAVCVLLTQALSSQQALVDLNQLIQLTMKGEQEDDE